MKRAIFSYSGIMFLAGKFKCGQNHKREFDFWKKRTFVIGFYEFDQTAWSDDADAKEEDNFGQNKLQCFDTHVVDVSGTKHPVQLFGT